MSTFSQVYKSYAGGRGSRTDAHYSEFKIKVELSFFYTPSITDMVLFSDKANIATLSDGQSLHGRS